MNNPLLDLSGLPRFSLIKPDHVEPAIDQVLADCRAQVETLLAANTDYTWDNLIQPLEDIDERLSRVWSPVSHMNSVVNSDELRASYNACLGKLSNYGTEMGQHAGLFKAYQSIARGEEYHKLDRAQKKIIDNSIRDFRLSGIDLNEKQQARYKALMEELSTLTSKFEEHILDATREWSKVITNEADLAGLPDSTRAMAQQSAAQREQKGWLFTLEFPSYLGVMTYADDREFRKEMYTAFVTRASDQGPHAGKWDNTPLMEEILALRFEAAQLLGFENYAERSIATKMAVSTSQVMEFLSDLADRSLPIAKNDLDELRAFAKKQHGIAELEAWDVVYYGEKLRQYKYSISQEAIKPYFPEHRVIAGMFGVVEKLYGLNITESRRVETWHKDVRFFEIFDKDGHLRGQFYLDLYARQFKRGGAWMDECIVRKLTDNGGIQTPVAYLTCNFSPPIGDDPALFTHDEVLTLFHEFGHGLHHMLTKVNYPSVSGINGVAWDAVELPSQFMENWCWEHDALALISGHYQSGETLPDEMFDKMMAAKNFQSGMQMVRQLEFSIFDFRIHLEFDPKQGASIYAILDDVRQHVSVIKPPSFNRFPHSFSHIFSGGYSAGYYSYKWAEVLSSDAFSLFEEKGIFDRETGLNFLSMILEQGGSRDPMELFIDFRGREPQIDALLRHSGIIAA
ncbi:Oligopeptidase A [hydrothermal vent metagenome]|uniref:oligopeptidase A n=1 Tax=hydrothermal vent metagenome TaxID=652676 RepID=A0A3B0ZH14_9ZZZZ